MKRMVMAAACAALLGAPASLSAQTAAAADPRGANLAAYVELLRSDIRSQKIAVLTELLELTDTQDTAFWPIYREYDTQLATLADERVAMIKEYAAGYGSLTDAQADALGKKAIDINKRRDALLESAYRRVATVTSPTVGLRFLQVEHQLLLILDLQVSAMLPIAK